MANPQSTAQAASSFEKGRIQALQEERIKIQKKKFTKWVNSFLEKVRLTAISVIGEERRALYIRGGLTETCMLRFW